MPAAAAARRVAEGQAGQLGDLQVTQRFHHRTRPRPGRGHPGGRLRDHAGRQGDGGPGELASGARLHAARAAWQPLSYRTGAPSHGG
jgi:hypothetical protein